FCMVLLLYFFFLFQAEDGIRDFHVTGFRRVLFRPRSGPGAASGGYRSDPDPAPGPDRARARGGPGLAGLGRVQTLARSPGEGTRSEERRGGKEGRWRGQRIGLGRDGTRARVCASPS